MVYWIYTISLCNTKESKAKTIENSIAIQKVSTPNPGTITAANKTIIASITNVKSPKVKILIGSDRSIRSRSEEHTS